MRPRLLVIGHVDASGRHGLAADLRTVESLDVEPLPVITGHTVGDPESPESFWPVSGRILKSQLAAALAEEPVAVLVGLTGRARHAKMIAKEISSAAPPAVVLAPLSSAFDTRPVLSGRVFAAVRRHLVPEAQTVVVPALQAGTLLGKGDVSDLRKIGEDLIALGARSAWVRAGGLESRRVDMLVDSEGSGLLDYPPASAEAEPHTAPAALAAMLALGTRLREAVDRAHRHAYKLDRTVHAV